MRRRTARRRSSSSALGADHLVREVRRLQHRHRGEPGLDELELLLLDGVPGAEVALGELVGEDAVDDHGVGQIPVEVQVGERPHGLGDDHPVRRHHQPHRYARGVAQQLVHRDEVADEPLHLGDRPSRRAAGRRGTCARAAARRRASTAPCRAPCPATSARRPGTTAAAASRRSARSRRRSRPTRRTRRGALSTSSENSSSPPGGTVSSSAAIRSTPRSISSAAEPLADRAPVVLHLVLRLHLLRVQALGRPSSARPSTGASAGRPRANAPGRWRSRACARRRPRNGARWRRRRRSCRLRPCPCRGSSAAAYESDRLYPRFLTVDLAGGGAGVAREVGRGDRDGVVAGLLRRLPEDRLGAAAEHARAQRGDDGLPPRLIVSATREIFESLKRSSPVLRRRAACVASDCERRRRGQVRGEVLLRRRSTRPPCVRVHSWIEEVAQELVVAEVGLARAPSRG